MNKSAMLAEMEERKAPAIIELKAEGQRAEGVLLAVENVTVNGKHVPCYRLAVYNDDMQPTGEQIQFLQTADLRTKLTSADRGKYAVVRMTGTQKTNNGDMRVFDVRLSKTRIVNNTEITDQDIPF